MNQPRNTTPWTDAVLKTFCMLSLVGMGLAGCQSVSADAIDNSSLTPPVLPDARVKMDGLSPDWVKTLILAELRIETATPEGTFAAATRVLDHYAEMGVNGLWIDPIFERTNKYFNGYTNYGLHTVDPKLSGKKTYAESFEEVRKFVAEAHKRNIRVFFDVIVWGTAKEAPLVQEHPEFYCKENGEFVNTWGGWKFNWDSPALREWYTDQAVAFIEKTGADGYRVDLAPNISGDFFQATREELYKRGRKIALISELPRKNEKVFDFAQIGVNGWPESMAPPKLQRKRYEKQIERFGSFHASEFMFRPGKNIVESIKTGNGIGLVDLHTKGEGANFRFYSVSPVCHDGKTSFINGNRAKFGYMLLTPFLPMWWIGEEWNNPYDLPVKAWIAIYFNNINWALKEQPENKAFFEDIKKYIRIRRTYPEIFENFPDRTRDTNIMELSVLRDGKPNFLPAYARYDDGKAVLVVPNYKSEFPESEFVISPNFDALGFSNVIKYKVTDLMSGQELASGEISDLNQIQTTIPAEYLGVYLIEKK